MTPLTLFGVLAVTAMLVCYALEQRSAVFVLLFAGACAASSAYGFLQGAWPFGVVEAVWAGVAVRRWRARTRVDGPIASRPLACDMSALAPGERRRYDDLRGRIGGSIREAIPENSSLRLRLDDSISLPDVAEWVTLEHRCCPFLNISVAVQGDDTHWVEIGGTGAIRDFVREEFAAFVR